MQIEFKKNKETVLYYQVILYEMLKKSKIFDDEGTADEDDKLMFKEITELNDERIRLDEYDELNAARRDPKKSLNRLS